MITLTLTPEEVHFLRIAMLDKSQALADWAHTIEVKGAPAERVEEYRRYSRTCDAVYRRLLP